MEPSIQAEVGSIRGANDAPADGHARGWWERYLLLLIPLLLITMYLVYIWPSYLDLSPIFLAWMVLVGATFLYVSVQVEDVLKTSEYRTLALKPDGTPVTLRKRRFASSMIKAATVMALYALVQGIAYRVTGNYESTGWYIFLPLIAALVFVTLFVLMWPGRASQLEAWMDTYSGFWVTVLVIVAVLLGSAAATWQIPAQAVQGPPASWSELLQFAQREAENVDKGAVLESVRARPPYRADRPYSPQSTAFEVKFTFLRPNGSGIEVEVLDTNPPRLQSVKKDQYSRVIESDTTLPQETVSEYMAKVSHVKISPRDAYRITEHEGLAFARQEAPSAPPGSNILDVSIGMYFDHDWQTKFGTPTGWNITYWLTGESDTLHLRVDGASGQVVDREIWPEDLGPTPSPSASSSR
jgi:hypothetical protein